jgi:DNA-binding transcriptional LysR family regulator
MIEMDAMIGTLEFIAATDWVTVLPSIICVNDIESATLRVNPIADPPLYAEFVVVEPARQALSVQATLFLEKLESEVARIHDVFAQAGLAHPA